jgi:hypothetical protein
MLLFDLWFAQAPELSLEMNKSVSKIGYYIDFDLFSSFDSFVFFKGERDTISFWIIY